MSALEAPARSGDHGRVESASVYTGAVRKTIADGVADTSLPASTSALSELFNRLETDGFSFDLGPCSDWRCP